MISQHEIKTLKIKDLVAAEYNPRDWDEESQKGLTASLVEFGMAQLPCVNIRAWDNNKKVIVGGHYRIHCLKATGETEVQCVIVHYDEIKEKALNLTLNNHEISGKFNNGVFNIIRELEASNFDIQSILLDKMELTLKTLDLATTDFSDRNKEIDFDELAKKFGEQVEGNQRQILTQDGDRYMFVLPNNQFHTIYCKSSLDYHFLETDKYKIDLVYSDPPYGIDVTKASKTSPINSGQYPEIAGDSDTEAARLFYNNCVKNGIKDYILWGYNYFAHWLPATRGLIVWDKDVPTGMSFADGETAGVIEVRDGEIAWTNQDRNLKIYPFHWIGNVIGKCDEELNLNSNQKRYHPTQKPVELQVKILQDWAKDAKTILDGFLGSGSSLIATHLLGKNMIGFEIIPHYVDMIIIRFIAHLQSRNQQFTILKNGVEMTESEIIKFKL
jgi:DNA modification methylase